MWLIYHVSENLILNQECSQKYNNIENNEIIILEIVIENGITINNKDLEVVVKSNRLIEWTVSITRGSD